MPPVPTLLAHPSSKARGLAKTGGVQTSCANICSTPYFRSRKAFSLMGPLSRYRTDNEIKRESCSERGSNELPPRGQEQHLERRISNVVSICAHTRVSRTRDPAISVLCARISEHVEECSGGGNEKKRGGGRDGSVALLWKHFGCRQPRKCLPML